jgi:dihydrofolate reductase
MSKVIVVFSMSLDGFISGANGRPEAGLGDGAEQLREWNNSEDPRTREIVESYENTGATIVGRTTYDLSIPSWGADGPLGAARLPTVVISHSAPQDVPQDSVYRFVNGVEEALETAKKAAGEKVISITGANVAQQFLTRGLIDEIAIHLVPVLFGSGTRLFEGLGDTHIQLEALEVVETPVVTHLRYRIVK